MTYTLLNKQGEYTFKILREPVPILPEPHYSHKTHGEHKPCPSENS